MDEIIHLKTLEAVFLRSEKSIEMIIKGYIAIGGNIMKKSHSRVFMTACALISILFIASIAAAQHGPQKRSAGWAMKEWWKNPKMIKVLEITKEQQKALNELSLSKRKEIIKLNSEKRIKQLDLITEMEKIRPDLKKVKEIVSSINETQGKILSHFYVGMVEGMNVLSEAQVEKFKEVMTQVQSQRPKMMRERMQGLKRQEQMQSID